MVTMFAPPVPRSLPWSAAPAGCPNVLTALRRGPIRCTVHPGATVPRGGSLVVYRVVHNRPRGRAMTDLGAARSMHDFRPGKACRDAVLLPTEVGAE